MKHTDPKTLPTVSFTETQAKARRLDMLIAILAGLKEYEYDHGQWHCGTAGCMGGWTYLNPTLGSEFRSLFPGTFRRSRVYNEVHRGVEDPGRDLGTFYGIPADAFRGHTELHNHSLAGVLAYLRGVRAEMG